MKTIKETLEERGEQYGEFGDVSIISQRIKSALKKGGSWEQMTDIQAEALEMIASKLSRIVNGNPNNIDSWHDISGYAKLAEEEIK